MELTQRRPEEKDCLFESLTWHLYLQYYSFTIQCHLFVCNGHRVSFFLMHLTRLHKYRLQKEKASSQQT